MKVNAIFAEYTTSTAFVLNLSKLQCNALMRMVEAERPLDTLYLVNVDTMCGLQRRGLVDWFKDEDGNNNGWYITEPGKLVYELLKLAGLSVKSTNTLRVTAAIARMGDR